MGKLTTMWEGRVGIVSACSEQILIDLPKVRLLDLLVPLLISAASACHRSRKARDDSGQVNHLQWQATSAIEPGIT
jgi:hypothetical protein